MIPKLRFTGNHECFSSERGHSPAERQQHAEVGQQEVAIMRIEYIYISNVHDYTLSCGAPPTSLVTLTPHALGQILGRSPSCFTTSPTNGNLSYDSS